VGALQLARQTLFFLVKTGDLFLVIIVSVLCVSCQFSSKTGDFFAHRSPFTRESPTFPAYKNLPLLLWEPLFVGISKRGSSQKV